MLSFSLCKVSLWSPLIELYSVLKEFFNQAATKIKLMLCFHFNIPKLKYRCNSKAVLFCSIQGNHSWNTLAAVRWRPSQPCYLSEKRGQGFILAISQYPNMSHWKNHASQGCPENYQLTTRFWKRLRMANSGGAERAGVMLQHGCWQPAAGSTGLVKVPSDRF